MNNFNRLYIASYVSSTAGLVLYQTLAHNLRSPGWVSVVSTSLVPLLTACLCDYSEEKGKKFGESIQERVDTSSTFADLPLLALILVYPDLFGKTLLRKLRGK